LAQNEILSFFKFLQKNVSRLDKRFFLQLLNKPRGFATPPKLFKIAQETFFSRVLKQPHVRASRAFPTQTLRGLRVVYSKNFSRDIFFVFWGTHLVDSFELLTSEVNLEKKRSVKM
jgi:hypothetical protein